MCAESRNSFDWKREGGGKEGGRSSAIELAQRLKYERTNKQAYGGGMRRSKGGGEEEKKREPIKETECVRKQLEKLERDIERARGE